MIINGGMMAWIPEDLRFKAEEEWKEHEQLRRIYQTARPVPGAPSGRGIVSVTNALPALFSPANTATPFWISIPHEELWTNAADTAAIAKQVPEHVIQQWEPSPPPLTMGERMAPEGRHPETQPVR